MFFTGCLSCGNRSQILLLRWHTVVFHPVDMGVYQHWSYIGQEVRKCSSVSTSFCGQWAHSLSSLESQVCLRWPFSIARLCSLSLYINLGQSPGIVPLCTLCLGPNSILVCSVFFLFFPMCQVIIFLFYHDLVGSNCVAVLGLCGVCLCLETEPQNQLA